MRSEKPGDEAAIRAVHVAAFPTPAEADLVAALRAAGAAAISEVALVDGAIVGHVLLQRALERARAAGASAVVLVGEPRYYRRFGFRPARELGLRCKWPARKRHSCFASSMP